MSVSLRRLGVLALGLSLAMGCGQDRAIEPTSPTAPVSSVAAPAAANNKDLLGGLVGGLTNTLGLTSVNGLQRTTPLANDITVVQTIGPAGGVLAIPAAGAVVVVPAGALSAPTQITMTARKGSLVAYDFAPHGITFARPLVFTQNLRGTSASLLGIPFLRLGYYADPSLLGTTTALVSGFIGGVGSILTWTFTAPIHHFSGYMVTCGRGGSL